MPIQPNLYALLGLAQNANADDIRRAYHQAALRLHPDVNVRAGATELFLRIQAAYEILSNLQGRNAYDSSLLADACPPSPISRAFQYSRSALPPLEEPQLVYALLELAAPPHSTAGASPPLNLCLVVDRSTSMQGEWIETAKAAAIELAHQLRPKDILSIVVFSDRAEVLLPAGWRPGRSQVEDQIRSIRTCGGTEIRLGLEAGFFEVNRNLSRTRINHILLLTDGHTYGDEAACLELAEQAGSLGIGITGLGIGSQWNDAFLDQLATRTGGASLYVSQPAEIQSFLQARFSKLGQAYAEQVVLQLETGPWVTLRQAYRLQPEPMPLPDGIPLRLGNIQEDAPLSVLLEFLVSPLPPTSQVALLAFGELSLDIPSLPDPVPDLPIELARPVCPVPEVEAPSAAILQAVSQVILDRMQERARQEMIDGDLESSRRRLNHLATSLTARGQGDLARTAMLEADRIKRLQEFSQEGQKRIKYGTRAFLLDCNPLD